MRGLRSLCGMVSVMLDADLLIDAALSGSRARASHLHGEDHWQQVTAVGLQLVSAGCGADPFVVFAFGVLHDSRRWNDGHDPDHGLRAATLALSLRGDALRLDDARMDLLVPALESHDRGSVSDDPTIGACWDADRLTLPRAGIAVDPALLSTAAARTVLERGEVAGGRPWPALTRALDGDPESIG